MPKRRELIQTTTKLIEEARQELERFRLLQEHKQKIFEKKMRQYGVLGNRDRRASKQAAKAKRPPLDRPVPRGKTNRGGS